MNIIITGASRGIGYEIVKEMSKFSQHSILAIARNKEKLSQLQSQCADMNGFKNVSILSFDLRDISTIYEEFISEVKERFSSVDILINNAGILVNKKFKDVQEQDFNECFEVNVKAPFFLIKSCLSLFSLNAHIVNIGTMGGVQGSVKFSGLSAYSSSKGALAIITECLAEEYKNTNWRFNCLALGSVHTEMLKAAFPSYEPTMSAKKMASFISDFAVRGGSFFNGKILPVALTTP